MGRWPSMCCPHAGSRSTSTPTASCLMRRTSWPCRWALRGQMGTPRGHQCRGVWAACPPHPHLGTPHGHCSWGVWAAWSPHPHLGTAGDTPWPLLWGALDSVVPPLPPWGHIGATPRPLLQGYLCAVVPSSLPWGQMGTPHGHGSGGSGHCGPPIPTLGTPHGHCSGVPGQCGHPILTLGAPHGHPSRGIWAPWSPYPHLGDSWGHPTATALGSPGHRGPPIPTLGTPHGHGSGGIWAPWSPHPHFGAAPRLQLWGPQGPGAALEQRMGPGLSVRRCRPRRRVFSEQQKPLCAASRQERGGPGWEGGGSGAAAVPCRAVVCRAVPCRAVPPQQGGDSFVPPCRRRRACR